MGVWRWQQVGRGEVHLFSLENEEGTDDALDLLKQKVARRNGVIAKCGREKCLTCDAHQGDLWLTNTPILQSKSLAAGRVYARQRRCQTARSSVSLHHFPRTLDSMEFVSVRTEEGGAMPGYDSTVCVTLTRVLRVLAAAPVVCQDGIGDMGHSCTAEPSPQPGTPPLPTRSPSANPPRSPTSHSNRTLTVPSHPQPAVRSTAAHPALLTHEGYDASAAPSFVVYLRGCENIPSPYLRLELGTENPTAGLLARMAGAVLGEGAKLTARGKPLAPPRLYLRRGGVDNGGIVDVESAGDRGGHMDDAPHQPCDSEDSLLNNHSPRRSPRKHPLALPLAGRGGGWGSISSRRRRSHFSSQRTLTPHHSHPLLSHLSQAHTKGTSPAHGQPHIASLHAPHLALKKPRLSSTRFVG